MSISKHDDDCPGCKPALIDVKTGQVMAPDSEPMVKINEVWAKTTKQEREAFHQVTCLNSRTQSDLRLMKGIVEAFQAAGN